MDIILAVAVHIHIAGNRDFLKLLPSPLAILIKFIQILEDNFMTERSVTFYADKLFVTPKHLSAVLKEISEKTAGEWIDLRVILEAKLLLRSTGLNIQEISTKLNFANQSFFGKYFKHLTGMSPRDYRAKLSEV